MTRENSDPAGRPVVRAGQRPALPPPEGVAMRRRVPYGTGSGHDLCLDLFFPEDYQERPPLPGLIFLHGGAFVTGSPGQFYRQAGSLAEQGIVCASISYRLAGEAIYPAALEDARSAVRWMRANAAALNVDPERIGCAGASAGGYLAAMLAATADHAGASGRVRLAVLFNPVVDLVGMAAEGVGSEMLVQFLGATPEERPDLYRDASPLTHVGPDTAPCLLFHGTADSAVPHAHSERFRDALAAAGVPVEFHSYEGQVHGFFNRSPYYEQTFTRMVEWLAEQWG